MINIDISSWNAEDGPPLAGDPPSVRDMLARRASDSGPMVAMTDITRSVTWGELDRESIALRTTLEDAGLRPGERVVSTLAPSVDFVVLLTAALRLGATFVPIHPATLDRDVGAIADQSEASLIITQAATAIETSGGAPVVRYWDLLSEVEIPSPVPRRRVPDVAMLIFTSGTTSAPKGVVCSDRQVEFALHSIQSVLHYDSSDVILSRLPVSFDYGLYQILLALMSGARLVFLPDAADARIASTIELHGVTVLPLVPSLVDTLAISASRSRANLSSVRLTTSTGEHLSRARQELLYELFPNARIATMYGVTESKRVSIEVLSRRTTVAHSGKPIPGTRVAIVDHSCRPVPRGKEGEIVVIGTNVTNGYWQSAPASPMRFGRATTGERLLFTGDVGLLDDHGRLHVHGRRDGVIKIRGVRVAASQIEEAAMSIDGVSGAAIVQTPEREPTLWIESKLPTMSIRRILLQHLPTTHVPRDIRTASVLPLTKNGKVDRGGLGRRGDDA